MTRRSTNWAGNVTFSAQRFHRPSSVEQLQALVAGAERVRALGTGHSFSRFADSTGDLISMDGLPNVMDIDPSGATVTVAAGVRYGELATHLHAAGYALRNLASLPHISVGGACATGTHGSGDGNGNVATAVSALEMVTAEGEMVTLARLADGDRFCAAVVAVGNLGIVTSLTLDIVPTFEVRQHVYDDLPSERIDHHLSEILASAYSVSLFTDWTGPRFNQVWLKRRDDSRDDSRDDPKPDPIWMDARLADGPRHPIRGMPVVNCTEQLGVPGPWHERLPHFRLEYIASSGEELQSEFFVPRHLAVEALAAIASLADRVAPVLQISEVRSIASDDLWMSPSYQRDSVAIHFTWIQDLRAVTPVLAAVEERLAPFEARPHWGKLFGMSPQAVGALYERMPDFLDLIGLYDPAGKFRNEMADRYFATGRRQRW